MYTLEPQRFYGKQVSVIQSSGMGKTRVMSELAKQVGSSYLLSESVITH